MKFNLFSSTLAPAESSAAASSGAGSLQVDAECAALTRGLHDVLADLPHGIKEKDQIRRLCDTVLDASTHLRLVWVGFCGKDAAKVAPHAAIGDAVPEATDWRLSQACFDHVAPFSQLSMESIGAGDDVNSLFLPWQNDMDACSANAALAIPLRSEKHDLRGLIVFYADDINYFSQVGIAPFQAFCHVAEIIWQQSSLLQMLTQKAQLDTLTGLMNRRKMSAVLQQAIERAAKEAQMLSILLLRLDGFGKINERYGWSAADGLLAAFSRDIALQMRPQDRLGRWTGLEFLVILPRTDLAHAEFLARGLQAYVATHPLAIKDEPVALEMQIGVAAYASQQRGGGDELLQQASCNRLSSIGSPSSAP